jgi:hypothetical protein
MELGERERKRKWYSISNIVKHDICEGRGYKDMYCKLLKNEGCEVKG